MNYTIKKHAPIIKKMYNDLSKILLSETSDVLDLKLFSYQLKVLHKYTVEVYEMAKIEEK